MTDIAIIGSGMAACGADHRFRREGLNAIVYEQAAVPGGHTRTHTYEGGWSFDEGPHVSFTKDVRIQELLAGNIAGDYRVLRANIDNYWNGYWIRHPAQCNLHGLPEDLVVNCLKDFITTVGREPKQVSNYADWLVETFGRTFAETFPMEYAKKVHTTEAANLSTDWLGPRLYRPSLEEVLRGAIVKQSADFHYVTEYRYPIEGGFYSYVKPFLRQADLRLNRKLVRVDPATATLLFASGEQAHYDHLICSAALPDLVPMIAGVPPDVREAASRLAATSLILVNIGIDRDDIGDTWTYFYDQDIVFARVSYPHRLSPRMAPLGCGSFQCEIYFSGKYRPQTEEPESLVGASIRDLRRCGLIRDDDRILHRSAIHVPYANIIHDHDKAPALALIHAYLDELGIRMCGRYGLWGYQWTDEAFITGEEAAEKVMSDL